MKVAMCLFMSVLMLIDTGKSFFLHGFKQRNIIISDFLKYDGHSTFELFGYFYQQGEVNYWMKSNQTT